MKTILFMKAKGGSVWHAVPSPGSAPVAISPSTRAICGFRPGDKGGGYVWGGWERYTMALKEYIAFCKACDRKGHHA